MRAESDITLLLIQLKDGKEGVYDKVYPLVYDQLRQLAARHISKDSNHTYSKTELVHEAYLKMIDQSKADYTDRNHFLAIASHCMRQIMIDYARKKHAEKRGGKQKDLTYIDEVFSSHEHKAKELLDIDEALSRLAELNERLSQIVEMRFFGGMTIESTADALGISESTVKRDWLKARGWLYKELKGKLEVE